MTELELLTEQSKRQRSADIAMEHRQWSVLDVRGGWKVKTHTDTYSIFPLPAGRLACSAWTANTSAVCASFSKKEARRNIRNQFKKETYA